MLHYDHSEQRGDEVGLKDREATALLTSGEHEEVFKSPLTHGGGRLAGQPLIVVVQNDDLAMGIFLRVR